MLGLNLKETRVYQEAKAEGREEGREEEGRSLVMRLLNRRFGALPEALVVKIANLSIAQIEDLAEALLEFQTIADLEAWLNH
jgi:predicted transposase YdaD